MMTTKGMVIQFICDSQKLESLSIKKLNKLLGISGESFFGKRNTLKKAHKMSLIRRGFVNTFLSKYEWAFREVICEEMMNIKEANYQKQEDGH